MKKITVALLILLMLPCINTFAKEKEKREKYGRTLNLGLGIAGYAGYYGYIGHPVPVFHLNYEFDVARNFTLAPFISIYTYTDDYYWGDKNNPYRYYRYRQTVIPTGIKGTYYFDQLLRANKRWDFYAAASLGVAIVQSSWENGYNGDKNYYNHDSFAFLDLHAGAEYHLTHRLGVFLDLSTGISTVGIAIHNARR